LTAPRVHHAQAGGASIAYQSFGAGPRTVVLSPSFAQNIGMLWEQPLAAAFFERLASFAHVIQFDKRGSGLSDRRLPPASLQDRVEDLLAVLDAEGMERATIMGTSEGGSLAAFFAATYPERTESLVLQGAYASNIRRDDHPWCISRGRQLLRVRALMWPLWGTGLFTTGQMAQSMKKEAGFRRWAGEFERQSMERSRLVQWSRMNMDLDVRRILSTISAPTLVLHAAEDPLIPIESSHYLAEHIPHAEFVQLPGADHVPWYRMQGPFLDALEDFIARPSAAPARERALATVLFTDIVGSTERAASLGDAAWIEVLERHDAIMREEIARAGGQWIDSAGDGVLSTFDSPSRAIGCAWRLRDRVAAECDLHIRAGIHTAEIELRQNGIGGIAVHEAARVQSAADPDQVVVSNTVRALVNGAGIAFREHGTRRLKGIPEAVELFSVAGVAA
jgi:class 3 adenylate cyclase/pimeloyl-ACP methyl ester carboxylesterase